MQVPISRAEVGAAVLANSQVTLVDAADLGYQGWVA